ncbi:MAG: hypothetical protein PVF33_13265 [Candidatus Latescibacterota bacterium]
MIPRRFLIRNVGSYRVDEHPVDTFNRQKLKLVFRRTEDPDIHLNTFECARRNVWNQAECLQTVVGEVDRIGGE